jgi:hypothetical protein
MLCASGSREREHSIREAGQPGLHPSCTVNGLKWVVPVDIIEKGFTYMGQIICINIAPKPKCSRTSHIYFHSK